MEGSRIKQAVHRIEAALARVEAASDKLAPAGSGDRKLAERHEAMRSEVASALHDLDKLIEGIVR